MPTYGAAPPYHNTFYHDLLGHDYDYITMRV